MEAITVYGRNIGLAFQTRDDILDAVEDSVPGRQVRPNSVLVFGQEETKARLDRFVRTAVASLEEAGIESPTLGYLATRLLDVKDENYG